MAVDKVFLVRRQQLALKLEATEGTAETLADADVMAPVFEPEWTPTFEPDERDVIQPSFTRQKQIQGERSAVISFVAELKGSGSVGTAPYFDAALKACGWKAVISTGVSVTYTPISTAVPSCTLALYEGSTSTEVKIKKIHGARGTVVIEAVKGQIVRLRFTFTGVYNTPTEGVFLTVPSPSPDPVAALALQFAYDGVTTLKAQTITLDSGVTVALRNDVNKATGNHSAAITGRRFIGSIDPEQTDIATYDFFAKLEANTEGILQYVLGTTAGNICTVNAPKAQVLNAAEGDRDEIRIETLDLQLNQSAAAGEDEISLVFT